MTLMESLSNFPSTETVCVALFLVCVLIIGSWRARTRKYLSWSQINPYPWVGDMFNLSPDPQILFQQWSTWAKESNHMFLLWIGPSPVLSVSRAECIETILGSRTLLKKGPAYRFFTDWLGSGLLLSHGEKWKKRRRLIIPTFHFSILMDFASVFEKQALILVEKLKQYVDDPNSSVDIQKPVSLAMLDAMCETSMGVKIHAQHSPTSEFVNAIFSLTALISLRQRSLWLWPQCIFQLTPSGEQYYKHLEVIHQFTRNVINKSIALRKKDSEYEQDNNHRDVEHPRKKKVFLDMLLDQFVAGEIDVEGIQEEVDTFMFAGQDTTSTSLSWILYELGREKNSRVQERLYLEISRADSSQSIVDRVRNLKYLDAVIKEGLRLHPPVPLFSRIAEEDMIVENKVIPCGTEISIYTYGVHRNASYWEDPDTFNPERFMDDTNSKRHPYSFIPFSAGSRNCVGQKFGMLEEKIMLYHLISNYRVVSLQEEEDVRVCLLILKSENGLLLQLISR